MKKIIWMLKFPIRLMITIVLSPMWLLWFLFDIAANSEKWMAFDLLKEMWGLKNN